jgi:hypothetical protein
MTNFTVSQSVSAGLLGLSVLLATSPAQALDLTGWSKTGDVSVAGSGGSVTNAFPGDDGVINFNVSPTAPADINALESFLNLSPNTLSSDFVEGSAIKQTFNAQAGDTFSFNWNFFTNEPANGSPDYAFVTINSSVNVLATIAQALTPSSPFTRQTGISAFSYTFPTAGSYQIGIGLIDSNDTVTSSALSLGNASYTSVIPTPALLPGLIGFGVAALRKRKQAA